MSGRLLRDLADPAAAGELVLELPAGARPTDAALSTTESLRPDRAAAGSAGLLEAGSAGERRSGLHVAAGTAAAAAFELRAPVTATGVALAALALAPGVVLEVEVEEDWHGLPSGRALLAGSPALGAVGEPAIVSAAAGRATIGAGAYWAVVRCRAGAAVWLGGPAAADTRTARDAGGGWVAGATLAGLALPLDLLGHPPAGGEAAAAATALRVGGAVVGAERDGDRATYPLTAPLAAAVAGRPAGGLVRSADRVRRHCAGDDRRFTAPDRLRRLELSRAQYHLPFAKPPNATRPTSAMISPIQKLHTTVNTMPTITRMPPSPMPPVLPPARSPAM